MTFRSISMISIISLFFAFSSAYAQPAQPETNAFSSATQDDIILPIGDIFNQRSTLWCWAFSTFHAMRTYYQQTGTNAEWRQALAELDEPAKLRAFLRERVGPRERHYPGYFAKLVAEKYGLPAADWQGSFLEPRCRTGIPTIGGEGAALEPDRVADVIVASLKNGAPAVFCNGVHCVAIYGVTFKGDAPMKFLTADSIGAKLREESAEEVESRFCSVLGVADRAE